MSSWYMLTVVGQDRNGIVAGISEVLFECGCQLGETSMMRLGGNFTMMCMVQYDGKPAELEGQLQPAALQLGLHVHLDAIEGHLHEHQIPNIRVSMHSADRPGIVASVTRVLNDLNVNILELESDVGGSEQHPIFIMHVEGYSSQQPEAIRQALQPLIDSGMEIRVSEIDTMLA